MTIWTPQLSQDKPIYLAIADAMAGDIMSGKLNVGDKLPPHRDLAWRLKVTVGTVTRAYKEAEIRGLLSGEVGRGSYVREVSGSTALPSRAEVATQIADLSHAAPPPVYSADEFDAALAHVMREPSRLALLDYMPPEGHVHYRAMGAKWLARSGIDISEANVIVTSGAHLGILACLSVLAQPGESVMAENLNYASLGSLVLGLNLKPVPLAMNETGLDLEDLERAAKTGESKILYLVPTLQNPTTLTMPREKRDAIVEIARRYNLTIVEDDIFRLLDDRVQPPTFYSLAPERTYHITSLSKTLAPGLRIGFVATPPGRAQFLRLRQRASGARVTGLTAEVARYWLETDIAEHLMRRVIGEMGARRSIFREVFSRHAFKCEPGAPFGWLTLPGHWSPLRFASKALSHNVRIIPGPAFSFGPQARDHGVRICFGAPATGQDLREALLKIRDLMGGDPEDDFTPVA
ncbi:MAG: PLP-dependent aminotransferase family protein [Hyphomicrobiales bacterium]|nr:PLP-dependent aminotransferase family protein [Hyphomicrobiales bacterium]